MSRKSTPVVGMSIILVLILAIVGVAYTWTGGVTVDGTVGTAGVQVEWSDPVGFCNNGTSIALMDAVTVKMEFYGAIPGDSDTCLLEFANNGTIPVVIQAINVDTLGVLASEFDVSYSDGTTPFTMDPGDTQMISISYTVGPDAKQFTDYGFFVTVEATD